MYYEFIAMLFDTMPLGERWVSINEITVVIATLAQGGPF